MNYYDNEKNPLFLPALIVTLIPIVFSFLLFYISPYLLLIIPCVAFILSVAGLIAALIYNKRFIGCVFCLVLSILEVLSFYLLSSYLSKAHKPVIYLYPETTTEVSVKLELDGKLTVVYPNYDAEKGWTVTAEPDGTLTDNKGRQYSYLYWEGDINIRPDMSRGFCVKGEDTAEFLENALKQLGLTDKEADDFITYWLPLMQDNKYNVITFQTTAYTDVASLHVAPKPDTVIRVNMLWYPSKVKVNIRPQELGTLNPTERKGFTVVEWGGEVYKSALRLESMV